MSDRIKHECGIALVRLLKPLSYYQEKYKTTGYGRDKLYLLMEKQHNRGQDGAGVANIKLDIAPGQRYMSRYRSNSSKPIKDIFDRINTRFEAAYKDFPQECSDVNWLKENLPFSGELFLGHLRYGTFGDNSIESCHPFLRQSNWMTKNLIVAGNFNLTNVDELFDLLVNLGQHPKKKSDTVTVLEKIGHFLDEENEELYRKYKKLGYTQQEITPLIAKNLDIQKILKRSANAWDGGYAMVGMVGHGDAFVLRDPAGIRPAFYYQDDEVVAVASERPALQTAFNLQVDQVKEIKPGHALVIKKDGRAGEFEVKKPVAKTSCSFERIYFSRGSDKDIYKERKRLGEALCPSILKAVNNDLDNTVFSFIPNTAEIAFYGLVEGMETELNKQKKQRIEKEGKQLSSEQLDNILSARVRTEKIAIKDAKLRTFITEDSGRDDLVTHVYDITYGVIKPKVDNLVVIDDSIVRGTTLRQSILRILDRLSPKKIVIASSAPQIRYPDCYGIDMAKIGDFVAFNAAIALLKENGKEKVIADVYKQAKEQVKLPKEQIKNCVKDIYAPFTAQQIEEKITEILTPENIQAEVQIIYQSVEGLHTACPDHKGDWYFTGNYPTPGGNKVVNTAFINYYEGNNRRAY
jgi:amidophosphoribosyltransferase